MGPSACGCSCVAFFSQPSLSLRAPFSGALTVTSPCSIFPLLCSPRTKPQSLFLPPISPLAPGRPAPLGFGILQRGTAGMRNVSSGRAPFAGPLFGFSLLGGEPGWSPLSRQKMRRFPNYGCFRQERTRAFEPHALLSCPPEFRGHPSPSSRPLELVDDLRPLAGSRFVGLPPPCPLISPLALH